MRNQPYSSLLIKEILESKTWAIGFLGIILSLLGFYLITASTQIEARWALIFFSLQTIITYIFARLSITVYKIHESEPSILPKTIFVGSVPPAYMGSSALILIEKNILFSTDSMVSIYKLEQDLEVLLAIGVVVNIQVDGKSQIIILQDLAEPDVWLKLKQNQAENLANLIIKPSIPKSMLGAP